MQRYLATSLTSSAILLLVLTGCPGSGGSSSSSGGGGGGACTAYYDALLGYLDRCVGSTGSLEGSRARFDDVCNRLLTAPGASNLSGQISTCAGAVSSLACGDDFDCVEGAGEFADGTACGEGFQCKSGFCKKADDASCGTCAARAAIGAPCDSGSSQACVEGARCVETSTSTPGSPPTESSECRPIKIAKAGEPCTGSSTEIIQCDKGLNCFFKSGSSGEEKPVCRAPVGDGQECGSRSDCVAGLACVKSKCAAPLAEGAACDGLTSGCARGFACDQTCKRIVKVAGGQECDQVRQCERGRCSGQSIQSTPTGTVFTPGKCVDPLPDGAACVKSDGTSKEPPPPCDVFAQCIAGKCTVPDPSACK